jgi:hypothetical protein
MGSSARGAAGSVAGGSSRGTSTARGVAVDAVCVDDGRTTDPGGVHALIAGQQLGRGVEGDVGALKRNVNT